MSAEHPAQGQEDEQARLLTARLTILVTALTEIAEWALR